MATGLSAAGAIGVALFQWYGAIVPLTVGAVRIFLTERKRRSTSDLEAAATIAAADAAEAFLDGRLLLEPLNEWEVTHRRDSLSVGTFEVQLRSGVNPWGPYDGDVRWPIIWSELDAHRQRFLAAVGAAEGELGAPARRAVNGIRFESARAIARVAEISDLARELGTIDLNGGPVHHADQVKDLMQRPLTDFHGALRQIRDHTDELQTMAAAERAASAARLTAGREQRVARARETVRDLAEQALRCSDMLRQWLAKSTLPDALHLRELAAQPGFDFLDLDGSAWNGWNTLSVELDGARTSLANLTNLHEPWLDATERELLDLVGKSLGRAGVAAADIWNRHSQLRGSPSVDDRQRIQGELAERRDRFFHQLRQATGAVARLRGEGEPGAGG